MVTGSKIKPHLEIVDESFEQKAFNQLCLCVQLSSYSFNFAIIDWANSKQLLLKEYLIDEQVDKHNTLSFLEAAFVQNDFLNKTYKKISVSISNSLYTFVPSPLFDAKAAQKYLQLNCKISETDEVIFTPMKNMNAICIFAFDKKLKSFFDYQFSEAKYLHQTMVLCDVVLNNLKNKEAPIVLINIKKNEFDVLIVKENKIELINTYAYSNADDLLYYLLYVMEQLSLNPDKQEVLISGEILKNSSIYERLVKYIRTVNFITRNKSIEYSYKFNELPEHFHYSLLNQYQEF